MARGTPFLASPAIGSQTGGGTGQSSAPVPRLAPPYADSGSETTAKNAIFSLFLLIVRNIFYPEQPMPDLNSPSLSPLAHHTATD
jgi:hypothetical protein